MIVVDCSALVFYLADKGPMGTRLRKRIAETDLLAAPGLLDYEIVSAIAGLSRGRRGGKPKLTGEQAERAIATYRNLPLDRHETLVLWDRVRDLSANMSAYDAQYVALAEGLHGILVTSDARISRSGAARCDIETYA